MQKGPVKENDENGKLFPLSGLASLAFLKAMLDVAVRGVTVLNVYSAICVIFWAKTPVNTVLKAAMVELPFSVFLILLLIRSVIKLVEQGSCSVDMGATLVLSEIIYIYLLGGMTTIVMFEASKLFVASVTKCIDLHLHEAVVWSFQPSKVFEGHQLQPSRS